MKLKIIIPLLSIFFSGFNSSYAEHQETPNSQPKNIAIIGTGYVGLVLGAALANWNNVVCLDIIDKKIDQLKNGIIPFFEPGLAELVHKNVTESRLRFSTEIEKEIRDNDIIFIAVGTPLKDDGSADLTAIEAVTHSIAKNINGYKLICTKSTVPIGTGKNVIRRIINQYKPSFEFDIASNPEFLREGNAVQDFLIPHRIVIGVDSERARKILEEIYSPLTRKKIPLLTTNLATAETIKYASNAFLATKISFINEMARLCKKVEADIHDVAQGMGLDERIGKAFLNPGPGYGGSCFPKDTQTLLLTAELNGIYLQVVKAAVEANQHQIYWILRKLYRLLDNEVHDKTVAILGLAFKENTDDVRFSPAISIIRELLNKGAHIKAYDPKAINNMKEIFPHISYYDCIERTTENADIVVVLTGWNEIASLDLLNLKKRVHQPILLDARNIFDPAKLRECGFKFDNVGRYNS